MPYKNKLKTERKRLGLSQNTVAKYLNITQQQYHKYESGMNELPIRYLIPICEMLEVSSDYLLGLSDTKERQ